MDDNNPKIGERIWINEGCGYTVHVPTEKFMRATTVLYGTVTAILPKRQVFILLDVSNGWSVTTGLHVCGWNGKEG